MEVQLGMKVKDTVSGLIGIAVCKTVWLNGCERYGIQPPIDKDGKAPDNYYVDSEQIEIIGDGVAVEPKKTGGPCQNPQRQSNPTPY